tara:strand:- start:6151 stop:6981 length:831 start_codon:yes stop_codon:yes gene_type:complete
MLGRIRREAESITINGSGIQGVQSVSANYASVAQPLKNLGINSIGFAPEGPQTATLDVDTLLINTLSPSAPADSADIMQNFTGDLAFSGVVNHGTKNFIFTEGYLETYSVSCSIGEIPQVSTSSVIYGEFGTGTLVDVPADAYPSTVNILSYSSMEINLDTFNTNRVSSFNVAIATPRLPLYAVGSDVPTGVMAGTPVEVNVNFTIEPDDYEIKNMRFVPDQTVFQNTVITLKKNNSDATLLTYSFDDMLLTSESFQGGVDSSATVNFNLRSFILR